MTMLQHLSVCLFVWGEQAGLLLIMMEAPLRICRWRALL